MSDKQRLWSPPELYDPRDREHRREIARIKALGEVTVRSTLGDITDDLFEMEYPILKHDAAARATFVRQLKRKGDTYGRWAYFAWDDTLTQYPDEQTWRRLLTYRNQNLVTTDEQRELGGKTIAFVGLSVGSNVAVQAAHLGMGEHFVLYDPDTISPTNLNRMTWATMDAVGKRKADALGQYLSKLNPYLEQTHYTDGLTPRNADTLLVHGIDLLYEHADHLPTKLLARQMARHAMRPLIMATDVGDTSLIDVERHDLGRTEFFLGQLSDDDLHRVEAGGATLDDIKKIVGHEHISDRLDQSFGQIGRMLGGFPQLGTTAAKGAAYAVQAGRDVLLGRNVPTGRSVR